jgi:hypothetical protein
VVLLWCMDSMYVVQRTLQLICSQARDSSKVDADRRQLQRQLQPTRQVQLLLAAAK